MNGQLDQQPLVSAAAVEPQKPRSQQQPKFALKNDQQDVSEDRLNFNGDTKGPPYRQRRRRKPKTAGNETQEQQQEEEEQRTQPAGVKNGASRRSGPRYGRRKPQEKDKAVAEIDGQDKIEGVQLGGDSSSIVSSNEQPAVENEQQQQQPYAAKKSRKRRPKTKYLQKNDGPQASDPDEHGDSTGNQEESFTKSRMSVDKPEKSTTKPEQPSAEEFDIIANSDNKRKNQKKKKKRGEKTECKELNEEDISKEVCNADGSEKQKGQKSVPAHQENGSKEDRKTIDRKSDKEHRKPEEVELMEPSKEQGNAGKVVLDSQKKSARPNRPTVIEETGPLTSKGHIKAGERTEKKPKDGKRQQKFSAFNGNRTQDLARNKNIPIEIKVYHPTAQKHRQKENDFNEKLFSPEIDLDAIHFALESPERTPGNSRRKFADQEFVADDSADRVLAELPLQTPRKQKRQQKEAFKQQEQLVPEKQRPSRTMCSKTCEPYVHPDDRGPRHQRLHFSPYLSPEIMEQEIQSGKLFRGVLRINKRYRMEAYVVPDALEDDIFIRGRRHQNRALDGDVVVVRMLDVDKIWEEKKEAGRKKDEEKARIQAEAEAQAEIKAKEDRENGIKAPSEDDEDVEEEFELDEDDTAEEVNEDKNKPKYAGEIVGILDRSGNQTYAGTLSVEMPGAKDSDKMNPRNKSKNKDIRFVWFRPTDKRVPFMAIPIGSAPPDLIQSQEKYSNILFTARIIRWSIDSLHPLGRVVSSVGLVGNIATETIAILSDNSIKDINFPGVVLESLPKTPWSIPAKEYEKRRDLREVRVFTIDPATAKDLDDAVHVKRLEDGTFEVGVHIADVSYFVKKNTPLNTEARERGTSTYLVDRVIPMLPSLLCEQLCSLNPSVERLAFSVIWKMDELGNILDTWFGRSIIKSCAKLAYDDAQSVIDGNGLPSSVTTAGHSRQDIEEDIMHLYNLSKHMRKRRFENGALSINSIRLCFELDDGGKPRSVWVYELKEANRLIEEFMLCANISVAQKISSHYPDEALLRRHAPPLEKRLYEFLQHSENLGYNLDGSSAGALQASFNAIESEQAKAVLTILAIKPMQRAKYFCTGAIDIAKYGHYALNVPLYTHFTSPIRRYADIIVHRLLDASLRGEEASGYDTKTVQKIALDCNRKSDGAKNAQDQNIQLYLAHYLHKLEKTSGPIIRPAVVVQVTKESFDVIVPEYGIEKRIPLDTLPIKKSKLDPSDFSLSVYWQKGVPVPSREDGSPTFTVELAESNSDGDSGTCPSLPIAKPSQIAALPSETYDPETGMQQFKVFTKFDVLIQPTITRSPPIISVYPINPYI